MDTENLLFSKRILTVDDDDYLRNVLSSQFRNEGVVYLAEAARASEAFEQVELFKPDLILLDIELPDGHSLDICQRLRARGFEKPIIIMTSEQDEASVVTGLDKVANDFITKPMRFGELLALVRAQLRQYNLLVDVKFTSQNVEFQPANKTLVSLDTKQVIVLTEKETMILTELFRIWPEAVPKETLLSEVWGYNNVLATHTLETHIYRLRQKISRLSEAPLVETTHNGYRLIKDKKTQD